MGSSCSQITRSKKADAVDTSMVTPTHASDPQIGALPSSPARHHAAALLNHHREPDTLQSDTSTKSKPLKWNSEAQRVPHNHHDEDGGLAGNRTPMAHVQNTSNDNACDDGPMDESDAAALKQATLIEELFIEVSILHPVDAGGCADRPQEAAGPAWNPMSSLRVFGGSSTRSGSSVTALEDKRDGSLCSTGMVTNTVPAGSGAEAAGDNDYEDENLSQGPAHEGNGSSSSRFLRLPHFNAF